MHFLGKAKIITRRIKKKQMPDGGQPQWGNTRRALVGSVEAK